ncbi:phosphoglycolate phosphatase [Vreelandella populi]|uniref:Phosphoglycolate phosphatase n=1 Tax=Vreelandella populi TaxID=2498858 RepID=A0A3S0YHD5_9GAMM|nr:phosphoglycolate phosphatase [Halomonas populi]RUR36077.1 phosphoglycolate phosphatase [Halomonas populi]RUR43180.1 phosphoglycolate phosphatase [Halomonas populi]RUR57636.1 phosphoglycolate phosphatase [Halomonas populi]
MHAILQGKRLIAFDLDGTLVDSVPDLARALQKALGELNLPVPEEAQVRDWVGNGAPVLVERALVWAVQQSPEANLQARAFQAFMTHYGAAPNALTKLYPGVKAALEELYCAGFTLALVTNKPERFISPILEHFGLDAWFSHCIGGDTLAEKKPSPLPLLHVAEAGGFSPHECLMVGDSRHDINAGKAAGFATLALPYGYNHGESVELSQPDIVLSSLLELVRPTNVEERIGLA